MPLPDDSAPPSGTQDMLEGELAFLRQTQQRLQEALGSFGYGVMDVPLLERTDLYLRKLGSQVAALLFNFTDQQGERISLRPEFTGSVIRSYIRHAPQLALPVRWQYCGPVFRDQGQPPRGTSSAGQDAPRVPAQRALRQFTQLGAELIGAASLRADAELLALACKGLQALGSSKPRLVLGHAGLVPRLLKGFHLSERVKMYLASHMDLMREGAAGMQKMRQGLEEIQVAPVNRVSGAWTPLGEMESEEASNLLRQLLAEGTSRPTGRRTPEEILQRFQARLQAVDDPSHLEQALALVVELASLRAAPEEALARGRTIIGGYHLDLEPLEALQEVVALLKAYGLADLLMEVDLGLTRALGYYTGIVFEVFLSGDAASPVGGGGRYDGLVRALGGPQDVPALGFAYTLERLVPPPVGRESQAAPAPAAVLVVAATDADLPEAIRYAESLHAQGVLGVLEVMERSERERVLYCRAKGIGRLVLVKARQVSEIPVAKEVASYAPAGAP